MKKMTCSQVAKACLGKTEKDAKDFIASKGFRVRTMQRDGEYFLGTMDLGIDRVNLTVMKNIVTDVQVG